MSVFEISLPLFLSEDINEEKIKKGKYTTTDYLG